MTEDRAAAARDLVNKAKAHMLLALSRIGSFDEDNTDTSADVMRCLAEHDGTVNVLECRDRVGMMAQILHAALKIVVAEERIEACAVRRRSGCHRQEEPAPRVLRRSVEVDDALRNLEG